MTTLHALIARHARERGDAAAILAPGRAALGYAMLHERLVACARSIVAAAPGPADRVAVGVRNGPEMAVACLGIASVRACIPLNPAEPERALRDKLVAARASVVVAEPEPDGAALRAAAAALGLPVVDLVRDLSAPAGCFVLRGAAPMPDDATPIAWHGPDDVALLFQTSGTTAKPKVVPLRHGNVLSVAGAVARLYALGPEDRCLSVMPLFHTHALVFATMSTLCAGASVVCGERFDEQAFFRWIAEFQPTWYTAVPSVHQSVIANAEHYRRFAPGHRFRFAASGSASMSPATLERLEAVIGAPVVESYGLTETSTTVTSNPLPPGVRKIGSVGCAFSGELAIVDERGRPLPTGEIGEVVVRGPGVMSGYEGDASLNAQAFVDGWFRTGDQGRVDADGYLFITGRIKEIVNRGGSKISPREIDDALLALPGIAQAAAFGFPHPTLGEDLGAALVLEPGAARDAPSIRAALAATLPASKVPSRIVFVDALPRTSTGKVQRVTLHETLPAARVARGEPRRGLTDAERLVADAWCDALGLDAVEPADNFFDLGGDSLRGRRIMATIERRTGVTLAEHALSLQTLEQIAASIEQARPRAGGARGLLRRLLGEPGR